MAGGGSAHIPDIVKGACNMESIPYNGLTAATLNLNEVPNPQMNSIIKVKLSPNANFKYIKIEKQQPDKDFDDYREDNIYMRQGSNLATAL